MTIKREKEEEEVILSDFSEPMDMDVGDTRRATDYTDTVPQPRGYIIMRRRMSPC